jgi:hypothetical protein
MDATARQIGAMLATADPHGPAFGNIKLEAGVDAVLELGCTE